MLDTSSLPLMIKATRILIWFQYSGRGIGKKKVSVGDEKDGVGRLDERKEHDEGKGESRRGK